MTKKIPVTKKMPTIPFIDLFCGAGGLSVGFEKAGFSPVFALDNDPFAVETFKHNHPSCSVVCSDIESIKASDIFKAAGTKTIPLIVGGPNCQGVSLRGKRDPNDPKNKMFFHFHRLIKEIKPDWFVMENVPGLLHKQNRELASDIFEAFEKIGYRCGADVLLAADYGVPQLRYRLFLIGNRIGAPVAFPAPTHIYPFEQLRIDNEAISKTDRKKPKWVTVADAISDLPVIPNGGGLPTIEHYFKGRRKSNDFLKYCQGKSKDLLNHVCHKTNDYNINLIKHIPQGKNWKSIPEKIRPKRFQRVALKDHTTTYGRLSWNMPSRTITCYFNNITSGAFTHPDQHRGISVREGARIQSFPDDFRFFGTLSRQYRQVGNAVPCLMATHVAQVIADQIHGADSHREILVQPAVEFSVKKKELVFNRPLKGMRFNLDKYFLAK